MNFNSDDFDDYNDMVRSLICSGSYTYVPKKKNLDLRNREILPAKLPIVEPLALELKPFPSHLLYAFFGAKNIFLVITATNLLEWKVRP